MIIGGIYEPQVTLIVVLTIAAISLAVLAALVASRRNPQIQDKDKLFIGFKKDATEAQIDEVLMELAITDKTGLNNLYSITLEDGVDVDTMMAKLAEIPIVKHVEKPIKFHRNEISQTEQKQARRCFVVNIVDGYEAFLDAEEKSDDNDYTIKSWSMPGGGPERKYVFWTEDEHMATLFCEALDARGADYAEALPDSKKRSYKRLWKDVKEIIDRQEEIWEKQKNRTIASKSS